MNTWMIVGRPAPLVCGGHLVAGAADEWPTLEVHVHCDRAGHRDPTEEVCCWCGLGLYGADATWQEREWTPRRVWTARLDRAYGMVVSRGAGRRPGEPLLSGRPVHHMRGLAQTRVRSSTPYPARDAWGRGDDTMRHIEPCGGYVSAYDVPRGADEFGVMPPQLVYICHRCGDEVREAAIVDVDNPESA